MDVEIRDREGRSQDSKGIPQSWGEATLLAAILIIVRGECQQGASEIAVEQGGQLVLCWESWDT